MKNKILDFFTKNVGFKLLALFFAFILWLVVYNMDDPNITKWYTTTVTVDDSGAAADEYYEILDGSNQVTFSVYGKRSVLNSLDENDFEANADLSKIVRDSDSGTGKVKIDISCKSIRYSSYVKINNSAKYLSVAISKSMSKSFNVNAKYIGEPADGYTIDKVTCSNYVTVVGPAEIVKKIDDDGVIATVDVTGFNRDTTDNRAIPRFYDSNGDEVEITKLTINGIKGNSSEKLYVTVAVEILETKSVPIKVSTEGNPANNGKVLSATCSPKKVKIKGDNLNGIDSIEIPAISVEGITENLETTVNIKNYLPEGVDLVDENDATVAVVVKIETYGEKTVSIGTDKLTVKGLSEDYEITFTKSSFTAVFEGATTDLADLDETKLEFYIDLTNLGEGTHTVPVGITKLSNKYTYVTSSIEITITKKATGGDDSGDDGNDDGTGDNEGDNNG